MGDKLVDLLDDILGDNAGNDQRLLSVVLNRFRARHMGRAVGGAVQWAFSFSLCGKRKTFQPRPGGGMAGD